MSIIIGGRTIETPGIESVSYLDDPTRAPPLVHTTPRGRRVRSIVLHSVHGKLGPTKAGFRASTRAEAEARYQAHTTRAASFDCCLDTDGTLLWQNDPIVHFTWHATAWNPVSMGIELVQDDDGTLYDGQLQTLVKVLNLLTAELRIQRQIPWGASGLPKGVLARLDEHGAKRGSDWTGIGAHYFNTTNRGRGDITAPFEYLRRAGYECFDVDAGEDLAVWKSRQIALGFTGADVDGVPLDKTCAALEAKGHAHGLWVAR